MGSVNRLWNTLYSTSNPINGIYFVLTNQISPGSDWCYFFSQNPVIKWKCCRHPFYRISHFINTKIRFKMQTEFWKSFYMFYKIFFWKCVDSIMGHMERISKQSNEIRESITYLLQSGFLSLVLPSHFYWRNSNGSRHKAISLQVQCNSSSIPLM